MNDDIQYRQVDRNCALDIDIKFIYSQWSSEVFIINGFLIQIGVRVVCETHKIQSSDDDDEDDTLIKCWICCHCRRTKKKLYKECQNFRDEFNSEKDRKKETREKILS